jgi:uncharacterized SAM-binding protein YcdF (DUF218 family)
MRSPVTEAFHALLSLPLWLFAGLALASILAWRSPRQSSMRRWRYAWVAAAVITYVVCMPVWPTALLVWLEARHPPPRIQESDRRDDNVIIVLTGGWLRETPAGYEQKIGEAGWERTVAAVELWRRIGGRLLFAGAPKPGGSDSAAAAMARVARALGVPEENLLVEPASRNTRENLLFSQRLLGARPGRLWLVTSAMHMPRSVAVAKVLGMDVVPFPCDYRADEVIDWTMFVPANGARQGLEYALHEIAGIAAYRLRGWS